jgi:hypothetical protein
MWRKWCLYNRKNIGTRGYLICTRGVAKYFDVLPLLYHSQTYKHVPCCHNMKLQKKKVTNEWASEYDISIAFPFSAIPKSKPKQKWANQWACSGVRVSNNCTPFNALCMYMYTMICKLWYKSILQFQFSWGFLQYLPPVPKVEAILVVNILCII